MRSEYAANQFLQSPPHRPHWNQASEPAFRPACRIRFLVALLLALLTLLNHLS